MAFGLGEQYERTSRPPVRTAESVWEQWREQRIDIACECWFTSQGKTMPLLIKFMDAEGCLRTFRNIRVNYMEERNYSGIHLVEYDCEVEYGGRLEKIKLFFYTAKCRWAMRFMREAG